jgi:hypothetical protein
MMRCSLNTNPDDSETALLLDFDTLENGGRCSQQQRFIFFRLINLKSHSQGLIL